MGYIYVPDVDAKVAEITAEGGAVHVPATTMEGVGRVAMVTDPQGAAVYGMTPEPPADDPDATAEAIDADGWLHTGDIGVMDERGYIQITDRMKDMFIVGGFNAYPAEIEQALGAHPHIAQAAVIGIPDERLGEVGMAFVVPTGGATVDPDEVIAWARERMANYKAPRRVEVIEALPLVPAGKVDKNALRTRAGV